MFLFLAYITVVWAGIVAMLLLRENQLIFLSTRTLADFPADHGLDAETLRITAEDGVKLHGWWIHGPGDQTVVWFHGNAGNISHRLGNARWFVEVLGVNVVLVDYRGYGESEGSPDETGVYRDGRAAVDIVTARGVAPRNIILFGRSLGAAVAIETALHRPAGGLAIESAFLSAPAMARRHYPYVPTPLVRTRMDNRNKIGRVRIPTLVLHGDRDTLVPLDHGRRLFEAAGCTAHFHVMAGAGHNDRGFLESDGYKDAWRRFLSTVRDANGNEAADDGYH